MSRLFRPRPGAIVLVVVIGLAAAWAQLGDRRPIDQSPLPVEWRLPSAPVLSPEESIEKMELPNGFRVEAVAAEPLVQDPIALAFHPDGRLFVVELPGYNWEFRNDLLGAVDEAPAGRVVALEDSNGDGRYDTRTVVLDGLSGPRSIAVHPEGILVLNPPFLWLCRDTDGDGRADEQIVIADDFGVSTNPHASPNGLLFAQDNWLYSLGYEARLRQAGGVWRRDGPIFLPGQWGISQDDYGRFFYSVNQDHLRGDLLPQHYWRRNPYFPGRPGINVRIAPDQSVWPHRRTPGVNRRDQLREDGRLRVFTANSSPVLYRGDQYPQEFYGNAFTCESAGNLVRRSILTEEDGILQAHNAYHEREFLFSGDERFRPVSAAVGPDGALYIVDMYRGVIEGRIFITTFLRNQILERGLHEPFNGMGRVYRIVYDAASEAPGFPPRPRAAADWVGLLAHSNGWWGDAAQQWIVQMGDRSTIPSLRRMAKEAERPVVRIRALWALEGLDGLDASLLLEAIEDISFRVRQAAVRLSEPWLDEPMLLSGVLARADDIRFDVRLQALLTLGGVPAEAAERAMVSVVRRDGGNSLIVEAAVSGLQGRELEFLRKYLLQVSHGPAETAGSKIVSALASAVLNSGAEGQVQTILKWISGSPERLPIRIRLSLLEAFTALEEEHFETGVQWLKGIDKVDEPEVSVRIDAVLGNLEELIERRKITRAQAPPLTEIQQQRWEVGRSYFPVCGACHGVEGQGIPSVAPPLKYSEWVLGSEESLIRIILNGFERSTEYPEMPPLSGMSDDQVAAILTYIRRQWGHQAHAVSPVRVAEIRRYVAGRARPWTEKELKSARE